MTLESSFAGQSAAKAFKERFKLAEERSRLRLESDAGPTPALSLTDVMMQSPSDESVCVQARNPGSDF